MNLAARLFLTLLWLAWLWPFAFRAPHGQKRPNVTVAGPTRWGLVLECLAILLASIFKLPSPPGPGRILPAVAIAALSIVCAWQAVTHLGRQFRVQAGLYDDHELVRTGPYAVVRHPIYASLLGMLAATLLLIGPWEIAPISLALFILGTEIRVRTEDRLLESRFGETFRAYRRQVSAYVPFVR